MTKGDDRGVVKRADEVEGQGLLAACLLKVYLWIPLPKGQVMQLPNTDPNDPQAL